MDDTVLVQVVEGLDELPRDFADFLFRQRSVVLEDVEQLACAVRE